MDNSVYHVKGGTKDRVVNLTDKTCTCRRFNLDLIPYSHACAAIRYVYNYFLYLHMLYKKSLLKLLIQFIYLYLGLYIKELRGLSRLITKKETLVVAYSGLLYHVCHPDK